MGRGQAREIAPEPLLIQQQILRRSFIVFTIIKTGRRCGAAIFAATLVVAMVARADITNGLVAYYNFEGLSGIVGETVVDQTGHGHDGICRQDQSTLKAPTIVAGPDGLGDALNFDGSFYVQIPNHPDFNITDNLTVAAWISVDTFDQAFQTIFCRGDWSWRLHRSNSTDFGALGLSLASGGNMPVNGTTTSLRVPKRWLHILGTYHNGVGHYLYINGVLEASNPNPTGVINTNGNDPVTIGAWINNGSLARQWKGQIDEVRLYNRALSAADVSELYGFTLTNLNVNRPPTVTVPADQTPNSATNLLLTATASDDGNPSPANPASPDPNDPHKLRWNWSVVSTPTASSGVVWSGNPTNGEAFTYQGSPNPPGTVFSCSPTASFDVPGFYVLNFSASDGDKVASKNMSVWIGPKDDYRALGYMYLSPLPGAEYTAPQTRFVLVRFQNIAPSAVTNLSQCIQVTGALSGNHAGQTKIASDNRTVIFQMSANFQVNELVTVSLNPQTAAGAISPYQYQFMTSGHLPDLGTITARGENPPNETKDKAFDSSITTKWVDLVVPNGTTNFSWIQLVYPGEETHVVNQYAITSAVDAPERDPQNWRFYGVDGTGSLILLDTRTNETFGSRSQTSTFAFTNTTAFRGYRLEITRVANPAAASGVQLAELAFIEPAGSVLRQYWLGITGAAVSDLTGNASYPDNPSGSDQLSRFEAPTDWADYYGTRVRGYITAPNTGSFVFWIASDDASELWLSTNDNPANKIKIAYVSAWCNSREWTRESNQKSAAINLVAGQKYYIEALQKEQTGGDNLAVGWAKPGQNTTAPSEVIPGSVLSPWTGGNSLALQAAPNLATAKSTQTSGTEQNLLSSASFNSTTVTNQINPSPQFSAITASNGVAGIMPNGVSVPSDFPWIKITVTNNPDPEPIFIDNRGGNGKPYNVIFDNNGSPIWYRRMPDERRDMKVQHNGVLTLLARDNGQYFYGMNTNYQTIATYRTVNGYSVDEHELQVLADGTYFLIGLHNETVDLSRYLSGGNPNASVTEDCIQQFTPDGDLIFQWRAWDHLDVASQQYVVSATNPGDFPHMNAIDVDTDGNILLSSRNTSEVTKINRDTGEIIWRLGGSHNQFTFVNDPLNGPRNQHSIRSVGTNRYILFDNGNGHSPQESRAVEYLLDPTNLTATITWQYPATPTNSLFSYYMGNVQRLPNGNTLINWALGNLPKLTEVRPDGTKAFEMNWVAGFEAYRVWRCPWQGAAVQPYLIVEPYPDNVTLIFNQFGDTNVAYYQIYGGPTSQSTNLLATSGVTLKRLTGLTNGVTYYFHVTAVNKQGVEGPASNEQSTTVNIVNPGQNMVVNGDFSQGTNSWIWTNSGTASATFSTINSTGYVHVVSQGVALSDIQLRQAGLKLLQGKQYVVQFDAWSSIRRAMEIRLGQDSSPFASYAVFTPTLTPSKQHFAYSFVMQNTTDLSARLMFNMGGALGDIYLDNVSVFNPPIGDLNLDGRVDLFDLQIFTSNWLKQQSGLSSDLDGSSKVDFTDFGILGENWSGSH
jgi:hypothetical protein